MCGLVGVLGNLGFAEERAFEDLLIVDAIRGLDSTGVAVVKEDRKSHLLKGLVTAQDLIGQDEYKNMIKGASRVMMGHNRAATKGSVTAKNAHPFEKEHIIGMHNGTLTTVWRLEDPRNFDTDSEAVFHTMAKKGVAHTWANLDGAAALVWYDKSNKTINLLRNSQRPLCFAVALDKKSLFWASEPWMLRDVVQRRNIKLGQVYVPHPNNHFAFRVSRSGNIVEHVEELKPFVFAIPRGTGTNSYTFTQNAFPYPRLEQFTTNTLYQIACEKWRRDLEERRKQANPPTTTNKLAGLGNILPFHPPGKDDPPDTNDTDDMFDGPGDSPPNLPLAHHHEGDMLARQAFYREYKNCTFCRETLADTYDTSIIIDDHKASCASCSELHHELGIPLTSGV